MVTAWKSPQTVTGTGWSASDAGTLVNAVGTNDLSVYASHAATVTDLLFCTNFDWGLVGTETIEGFEVRIVSQLDGAIIAPSVAGLLVKGTADAVSVLGTGSDMYPIVAAPSWSDHTIGGPNDDLGHAWAGIDVGGNTNFGFGIRCSTLAAYIESLARGRRIDYVEARVFYSPATAIGGVLGGRHFQRIPDFGQIKDFGMVPARRG